MRILQITSSVVCGKEYVGKWWCSDSIMGDDGDAIIRYLQHDGTWGRNTQHFDSQEEVNQALAIGNKPDFVVSKDEELSRQCLKDWQDSENNRDFRDYDEDY